MDKTTMEHWEAMRQPPPSALKQIGGGRLKGMTDIKPQWRYQVMTEQFGPCGKGWKFTIEKQWTEQGSDNQIICFCNVNLFVKLDGEWSSSIPGTGGSMLVEKEKAGLHTSDEGFKMALTDALSTAMSKLGVAADIYMGNWTGTKYKDTPIPTPPSAPPVPAKPACIDKKHAQALITIAKSNKWPSGAIKDHLKDVAGCEGTAQIEQKDYQPLMDLMSKPPMISKRQLARVNILLTKVCPGPRQGQHNMVGDALRIEPPKSLNDLTWEQAEKTNEVLFQLELQMAEAPVPIEDTTQEAF